MTTRYIRLPELLRIVPVSPMTLFRWERKGQFPRRTRLGPNVVAWKLGAVLDWVAARDRAGRSAETPESGTEEQEPAENAR